MGSPAAAAWIAQVTFWTLIAHGIYSDALSRKTAAIFVTLWSVGYVALPRIAWWTGPFVTSWVAVLDIALVFIIFKGDVRLT